MSTSSGSNAGSVVDFYAGKNILISGATGFLGKVLIEKLLWEELGARPLRLLARGDPSQRLSELALSGAFSRLQQRHNAVGDGFTKWLRSQVEIIACDLEAEDLGMDDAARHAAFSGLGIVLHCAARVSWDERLDVAIKANTLGSRKLFAACADAADSPSSLVFLHISSTFVHGMGPRPHTETTLPLAGMRSRLQGSNAPQFDMETVISEALQEGVQTDAHFAAAASRGDFRAEARSRVPLGSNEDTLRNMEERLAERRARTQMSEYGIEVARKHGWWDPYTLSKAMAELHLEIDAKARGIPLVIVRPSGITSSAQEPTAGWIDCYLLNEPIIEATGRGQLTAFPGRQDSVLDMVPADFVVNLTLVAATRPADPANGPEVYQVGSGQVNPVHQGDLAKWWHDYFSEHPFHDARGKPLKPAVPQLVGNLDDFLARMRWRAGVPIAVASALTNILPTEARWARQWRERVGKLRGALDNALRLANLYSVYTLERFEFCTDRGRALMKSLSPEDQTKWNALSCEDIDWKPYFDDLHIPGMRKHVLRESGVEPLQNSQAFNRKQIMARL